MTYVSMPKSAFTGRRTIGSSFGRSFPALMYCADVRSLPAVDMTPKGVEGADEPS
jgi:hypothetical protein